LEDQSKVVNLKEKPPWDEASVLRTSLAASVMSTPIPSPGIAKGEMLE